jgi:Zn-dependent oligopeptidase
LAIRFHRVERFSRAIASTAAGYYSYLHSQNAFDQDRFEKFSRQFIAAAFLPAANKCTIVAVAFLWCCAK